MDEIRAVIAGVARWGKSIATAMESISKTLESIEKHLEDMNNRDYRRDL